MQQKLGLARALLHRPELLILDEPVSGLDPHGIRQVRELLLEERARGTTIFISSHILSEVERTADRVGILACGRLVAEDAVSTLLAGRGSLEEVFVELTTTATAVPARGTAAHPREVGTASNAGYSPAAQGSQPRRSSPGAWRRDFRTPVPPGRERGQRVGVEQPAPEPGRSGPSPKETFWPWPPARAPMSPCPWACSLA